MIHRLGVELLTNIFELLCSQYGLKTFVKWKNLHMGLKSNAPYTIVIAPTLTLAQTCAALAWRRLALTTPSLWSKLSVDIACNAANIRDVVDLYLKRSSESALTLEVELDYSAVSWHTGWDADANPEWDEPNVPKYSLDEIPEDSWTLLRALLSENHRWCDASFIFHRFLFSALVKNKKDPILNLLNAMGDATLGLLERLKLSWEVRQDEDIQEGHLEEPKSILFFDWLASGSPKLHTVTLTELNLKVFKMPNKILLMYHLRNLRTISCDTFSEDDPVVGGTSLSDIAHVLQNCTGLEVAELDMAVHSSLQPFTHNTLRSLKCKIRDRGVASEFFSAITLPSLKQLTICFTETEGVSESEQDQTQRRFLEELEGLLGRSSSQLQHLALDGPTFRSDQELITVVSSVPTVTHLVLGFPYSTNLWTDALVVRLTRGATAELLPSLLSIDITITWHGAYSKKQAPHLADLDMLYSMLHSRVSPTTSSNQARLGHFGFTGQSKIGYESKPMSSYLSKLETRLSKAQFTQEGLQWFVKKDEVEPYETEEEFDWNQHHALPMFDLSQIEAQDRTSDCSEEDW
ncbi:hypothetical protein VKT23_001612 [Stygiomarasmius scandens]|uniref:F-box domain-containing protein n=1 Tax=Marasmiellus scandens TaxID=2682957 RepID=A0ABR1JZY7_9AGAR